MPAKDSEIGANERAECAPEMRRALQSLQSDYWLLAGEESRASVATRRER